jgi:hypothetical protein
LFSTISPGRVITGASDWSISQESGVDKKLPERKRHLLYLQLLYL